jgi:hypothetical protein
VTSSALAVLTEAQFQRTVTEALRVHGWKVWHNTVAWRSDAGWPDLVAVHPGQKRVLFLELKTERGKLSEKQGHWRDLLVEAGQEWYCLRPSDWELAQAIFRGDVRSPVEGAP